MKKIGVLLISFLMLSSISFAQGKLERAKRGLSESDGFSFSRSTSTSRSSRGTSDATHGLFEGVAIAFIEVGLYATYFGLIESPEERQRLASKSFITKYPYHSGHRGNYAYYWDGDTNLSRITISNRFIAESSQLYGNHINADFKFFRRLSLEADYLQLWENTAFSSTNTLAASTFLLKYHRIRIEKFNAYWGMGATYVGGDVDELGFTYGIGAEYFFARPMSIELNYNQTLINTRSFDKFHVMANYHIDRFKVTGGYEYLRIGGVNFSTLSVGLGVFL